MEKLQELSKQLEVINTEPAAQCALEGYSKECLCDKCHGVRAEEENWDWDEYVRSPSQRARAHAYARVRGEDAVTAAIFLAEEEGSFAELLHRAWIIAEHLEWAIKPAQVIKEAIEGRLLDRL